MESQWGILSKKEQEELKASGTILFHTAKATWYDIQGFCLKEVRDDQGKLKHQEVTKGSYNLHREVLPMINLKDLV